ncbi:hypothetical protein BRADI_2g37455v3 [Brachypodium distachyon]|uniref:Uncharacterized protein n=1 Tax=Brachypodium distachyon TaxID=15368 RepID=A0A0Q3IPC1_BRADI|nr:hypothetical protein BRADI_2g37455v3 [Brachypodium distachyon]
MNQSINRINLFCILFVGSHSKGDMEHEVGVA